MKEKIQNEKKSRELYYVIYVYKRLAGNVIINVIDMQLLPYKNRQPVSQTI